jgi:aminoglycoside phosphotransferase (APT) family kinase protein
VIESQVPYKQKTLSRLLQQVFPNRSINDLKLLSGGLINTNIKVSFASNHDPVVVRLYRDGAGVCRKELALHNLVQSVVPVPKVLHAEPDGFEDLPSFSVLQFVAGLTFQELKRTKDLQAIQQAASLVGKTLAVIGSFDFLRPGRLEIKEGAVTVGSPFIEGPNLIPRLLDRFLGSPSCQQRLETSLIDRIHAFGWFWSSRLPHLDTQPSLVHCDFGDRNILVREEHGRWVVAAILDWELAISGSPLLDVGHFLRYERTAEPLREPHFSRGFVEHGGRLPDNWRKIIRVIDLTGLVECLTHDNLPEDVETDLLKLIDATLESEL